MKQSTRQTLDETLDYDEIEAELNELDFDQDRAGASADTVANDFLPSCWQCYS